MKKRIIINGSSIKDIPTFYQEINRIFMSDENWEIGQSLDAFNDLLYGGFGVIKSGEAVELIWNNSEESRQSLGYAVTKAYYNEKLKPDSPFNKEMFREKLVALENGNGETYFEIILSVITDHPTIELILD
ncbi:Barstar (barnase inhibitor) [Dyadobacter koreensis]|uniref:Barstar (Barnase inhibitor) n=1 Tax=Dyadobacter koreensis TaxID=408657 RepID=A0A1H7A6C3_9BACT|nr:barstar family protein [Dyadobacter koreensis]SEJ61219.1 Barstar (barnase inhibitor) [Dyadobacter koreensis]